MPATYQKTCLICPHCAAHTDACVDHLGGYERFGPWYCDACGGSYSGARDASSGAWVLTPEPGRKVPTLDLLVLRPQSPPVYLARRGFSIVGDRGVAGKDHPIDSPESQDSTRFYYEEYSCPTNWLNNFVMMAVDRDHDPHGVIDFVRRVARPAAVGGDDCSAEVESVLAAFPEIDRFE